MEDITKSEGSAASRSCPRQGMVYLSPSNNELLGVPTNCKSWGCKSCRDRKLGYVASLMQYGLSGLEQPYLVSVTYVAHDDGYGSLVKSVTAASAQKDWRELVRRLKRNPRWSQVHWFRVIELTKRFQVHAHLLMGNLLDTGTGTLASCRRSESGATSAWPTCQCIACEISMHWLKITKDSWIIDVTPVYDKQGVSWYLCKYLQKGMYGRERRMLDEKGFTRRYYRSGNWAADVQMRRRGTVNKVWTRVRFEYGPPNKWLINHSKDHPDMQQVGTPLATQMAQANGRKRIAAIYASIRKQSDLSRH